MIDIYVINLKKRTDRLEQIKTDFYNYNLNIVEAEENIDEGWKGCFKSHLKCISLAKEKKLNYIIVIEDDCKKTVNFDINLIKILNWLEKNLDKWNIFLGGVTGVWNYNHSIKICDDLDLIEINLGKTYHFTIYNSNSYDFYLNHEINIPIDKCWHNKLIGLVSIPFIAIQSEGYSNIENKQISYDSRFNGVEKHFLLLLKNK
jgi:hypothetical protein